MSTAIRSGWPDHIDKLKFVGRSDFGCYYIQRDPDDVRFPVID